MEIVKLSKKSNNLYKIEFSDNTSLNFYDDTIIKYNLLINKKLDAKTFKEIIAYNDEVSAYYKAINYIKQKLRTKKEIENKLKKLNYNKEIISNVIKKLENQGYLNDELYIKSYINDQINLSIKGPKKIKNELEKLGFKNSDEYLNVDNDIWINKINKIITKKEKSNHNLSKIFLINKIKSDLINLGYPDYLYKDILENYEFVDNPDILKKEVNKFLKKYQGKYNEDEIKYKLKGYLYSKGFNNCDIDDLLNN